ncbi:hypothetical protein F5Y13DRAFT_187931 [Hypoxylon sp. FL1857]|nr:hypothetical protein F5Y13DRAFT_187931 [Hypoxylon sp. FL1857]
MAMILHLEAHKRVQTGVSQVCTDGKSLRLLEMTDLPEMPSLAATVKGSSTPAVDRFHRPATRTYRRQGIPFDDPDEFLPERWIDGTEGTAIANFWGFGGGR